MAVARYGNRYGSGYGYGGWAPYVPVAERRRQAAAKMNALRKKGVDVQPVTISGRQIASSFWGEAWCEHLESFSDFENRLPRGRTYVRNGSVCHLSVTKGAIEAKVSGSELYTVAVKIKTLPPKKWQSIKQRSSGQIGSLLELLQGQLSDHVMEIVTDRKEGLFPLPGEMSFHCSCPDWASMCKHVAAVLYGIGARLDTKPELLFTLRGVNHEELIEADATQAVEAATSRGTSQRLADADLGEVFGIELAADRVAKSDPPPVSAPRVTAAVKPTRAGGKRVGVREKTSDAAPGTKTARKSSKVESPAKGRSLKKAGRGKAQPTAATASRVKSARGKRKP